MDRQTAIGVAMKALGFGGGQSGRARTSAHPQGSAGSTTNNCPEDYVCFKDGTIMRQDQYEHSGHNSPVVCPPGMICFEDGSRMSATDLTLRNHPTGGASYTPQPTGRQASMPGAGPAFAAMLNAMQSGGGGTPVESYPQPGPPPTPYNPNRQDKERKAYRLSGSGGNVPDGGPTVDEGGDPAQECSFVNNQWVCWPSGEVGTRQYPAGTQGPDNPHRTYADGTGGRFYVPPRLTQTVTPTRDPNQHTNPQAGMDFAALLELFRNRRR